MPRIPKVQPMTEIETEFLPIDRDYLDASYTWLRDEAFAALIMATPVTKAAQIKWFSSLKAREDYYIRGIKYAGAWIGGFGLRHMDRERRTAEYWVQIYPEEFRSKGIGTATFGHCKEVAREFGITSIDLYVAHSNRSALKAYERWGFSPAESERANAYRMTFTLTAGS